MEVLSFTKKTSGIGADRAGTEGARAATIAGSAGAAPGTGARSNRLLIIAAIANFVTLAVAALALQMAVAASRYRQELEDQARQLRELAATVESMRARLGPSASGAASVAPSGAGSGGSSFAPFAASSGAGAATGTAPRQDDASSNIPSTAGAPPPQAAYQPARLAPSATVLQVAAVVPEADALALATELQQKGFPAFVLEPARDQFYRVQVGPYVNVALAKIAQRQLKSGGFGSIIKRRE
jgi:cell division septation protein DedD